MLRERTTGGKGIRATEGHHLQQHSAGRKNGALLGASFLEGVLPEHPLLPVHHREPAGSSAF